MSQDPPLTHTLQLQPGKFLSTEVGGTKTVFVALPIKDCLTFPGIKDGSLFHKSLRQSLGIDNAVTDRIKHMIYNMSEEFFVSHDGITAICDQMELDQAGLLRVKGVSVVGGCELLTASA